MVALYTYAVVAVYDCTNIHRLVVQHNGDLQMVAFCYAKCNPVHILNNCFFFLFPYMREEIELYNLIYTIKSRLTSHEKCFWHIIFLCNPNQQIGAAIAFLFILRRKYIILSHYRFAYGCSIDTLISAAGTTYGRCHRCEILSLKI